MNRIVGLNVPQLLILLRLILAPIMVVIAWKFQEIAPMLLTVLMYIGLLSDIFDGIIARKQNLSTEKLRRLDSQTDLIFWIGVGVCCWLLRPEIVLRHKYEIGIVIVLEMLCYLTSIVKFGKETCTHAFLSKIWGITLLAAFTSMIGFNHDGVLFTLMFVMACISQLDVILIVLILPKWQHDIPSCYHAMLIRKGKTFKKSKLLNS